MGEGDSCPTSAHPCHPRNPCPPEDGSVLRHEFLFPDLGWLQLPNRNGKDRRKEQGAHASRLDKPFRQAQGSEPVEGQRAAVGTLPTERRAPFGSHTFKKCGTQDECAPNSTWTPARIAVLHWTCFQSHPVTIQQAFEVAIQHHQSGRLAEAEALYRQILAVEPRHADALHLLGIIAHQAGRGDVAVELIRQAIALAPGVPDFHSNLGEALRALGKRDEAEAAYRAALELGPDHAEAHSNLGNVLREKGRFDESVAACRRALELKPDHAGAHNNMGSALALQGRIEEAIAAYRRALELKPGFAEAHCNLGAALRERGRFHEAAAACRRALQLRPDYAEAMNNLGVALSDQGLLDEAITEYRRALQLKPDYAEVYSNLGNVLRDKGRLDEAIAEYRRTLQLKPGNAEAHSNLGNVLREKGRLDEAIAACRRAIELRADHAEAYSNLGNALNEQGRLDEAVAAYRKALELKPDFAEAHNNLGNALTHRGQFTESIVECRRALELRPGFASAHCNLLLNLHYLPDFDAGSLFGEHCRWEEVHARPLAEFIQPHPNARDPERRLRVGYVSPDLREHSVAFFLENLLACHDPGQVEVFCYASLPRPDHVTERLQGLVPHWRDIYKAPDAEVAGLIRKDGIDILVDLAGHTGQNRLLVFARKPAPVQVTWLGYPDTTGLKAMDYRLTDARADPPGTTEHLHTEQLVRLPDCAWCFRPSGDAPPASGPPVLRAGHITFGCFNALPKINAPLLRLWSEILLEVPGSRLLLKNAAFRNPSVRERMRSVLEKAGIVPERIELAEHVPGLAGHLASYGRVDIALDTFPYHGTATTCEALWMGVPVVTLAGQTHVSRVGVSLLDHAGLAGLAASSPEEYVRIAAALGRDAPRLAEFRASLRERMAGSPLMDGPRFARNVEQAYRQMWRAWCGEGR